MELLLNPKNYEHYRTLLKAKRLPRYEVRGRRLCFPDEYASLLGLEPPDNGHGMAYEPAGHLYDYQSFFSRVAVRKKKFCLFWDCGLGKTLAELEFARHCAGVLGNDEKVLIVTPLMVVKQFLEEANRFYGDGLALEQVRSGDIQEWCYSSDGGRIGITNWESFKTPTRRGRVGCMIADECSIWKSHYGTIGRNAIDFAKGIEWKLAATGTPAPNDCQEYAHHAVFVDAVRSTNEFLARYFVNRGETSNRWELRPHAKKAFYREISHWCVFLTEPSTYGFEDNSTRVPPIHVHIQSVDLTAEQENAAFTRQGTLFATAPGGIVQRSQWSNIAKGRHNGKRIDTKKPAAIKRIIDEAKGESVLVWCLYNHEQDSLHKYIEGSASISGSTPLERRIEILDDFRSGRVRVLISKPKILGFGLNLQICTRMIFSGLQDSYESYYQAVKRANRIGSTKPLHVHIPVTEIERPMIETVLRKAHRVHEEAKIQESLFSKESLYGMAD